jgi:DNA-directed RNA polymerase subunit RPC12/RpoP
MVEYIEREAAINALWKLRSSYRHAKEMCVVGGCVLELKECVPTADVVEVRHGEWVKTTYPEVHRCSHCNKPSNTSKGMPKYCPNCGAKMDGKGEGE